MTLLFVDSSTALRSTRTAWLREKFLGYTIVDVPGPAMAAGWLAQAIALDVLVTEAIFPTQDTGFALRDTARARFPQVRVLFTTRYDLSGFEDQVADALVLKDPPYSPEKLEERLRTLLAVPVESNDPPPVMAPGTVLGNYQVLERLYVEKDAETYRALQVTVQRPVALVLLKPEHLKQPEIVAKFKERERVKASLMHPRIAPLYEAGEANGWLFYTRELPRGRSLAEIQLTDEPLSERRLADVLHGVAEAMKFATSRGFHHRSIVPRDIYIDAEHQSSIVNFFRPAIAKKRDPAADVLKFLDLLRPVAADSRARGLLQTLAGAKHDWGGLLSALEDVRGDMRERSIVRKIEAETLPLNMNSRSPWWVWTMVALTLVIVAGVGALMNGTEKVTELPVAMVRIPAGKFEYQKEETVTLPVFWISKHEVTIGQYAQFLHALKATAPGKYDHALQPKTKTSHEPTNWRQYHTAAKAGTTFNGESITLNTPVSQVDWWDAYAFTKWNGQRLPTEQEWEKAARGDSEPGLIYPWGNQPNPKAANLGDDYIADPKGKITGGGIDGYNLWAPIDRITQDVSPYGVCDMAGNVSEWTAGESTDGEWPAHPSYIDIKVPVVRGGHFGLKINDQLLTDRRFPESANEATLARGFRTASSTAPAISNP